MSRFIDNIIYHKTTKPKHYVEVKNPPKTDAEKLARPQDARQVQYNNWCKFHQIYSGSYLPYKMSQLASQGWTTERKSFNYYETEHIKQTTGQHVLRHGRHINKRGIVEPTHYHWKNDEANFLPRKERNQNYYYDKYGESCGRGSEESHLKPHKTRRSK